MLQRFAALTFLLGLCSFSFAQTDRAVVTGTILDSTGSPIANAAVTVESKTTGLRRSAVTSSAGSYTIGALPIGVYTASVSASGFQKQSIEGFELQVGQTRSFDF